MPTYTYRRADGTAFDIEQRITEDALETCPTTGQPVQRVITSGAGLVFKGSGFYLTDYARRGANGDAGSDSSKNGSAPAKEKSDTAAAAPSSTTNGQSKD